VPLPPTGVSCRKRQSKESNTAFDVTRPSLLRSQIGGQCRKIEPLHQGALHSAGELSDDVLAGESCKFFE
jgi:hypothetical protein